MRTRRGARVADLLGTGLLWAVGVGVLALLVAVLAAILGRGLGSVSWRFLTSLPADLDAGGGVGPMLWNTIYLAVLSTALVAPLGIGAAVWLTRYARPGRLTSAVRYASEALATVPSIVLGMLGFLVFVVTLRWGFSRLGAAATLALLNLPLMMRLVEEAIRGVPEELEEASLALGATRWQTTWRVTLPVALPGISTAVILTAARVFGESAPLLFTAGTGVSHAAPYSLDPFAGGATLAVHLWYVNSEGLVPDAREVAAGAGAVLVLAALAFNLVAAALVARQRRRLEGR